MPRLAPKPLELEKVEKEELEKLLARHNLSVMQKTTLILNWMAN